MVIIACVTLMGHGNKPLALLSTRFDSVQLLANLLKILIPVSGFVHANEVLHIATSVMIYKFKIILILI